MAPPRKRARTAAASQTPNQSTPPTSSPAATAPFRGQPEVLTDPWTPAQMTSLFKAIIRAKPTGIHKHMHMISILQSLHDDHSVTNFGPAGSSMHHRQLGPPQHNVLPRHLKKDAVWKKLESLYDLSALDEREDAYRLKGPQFRRGRDGVARELSSESDDAENEARLDIEERPFSLIGRGTKNGDKDGMHAINLNAEASEFAHMMWGRRLQDAEKESSESFKGDDEQGDEAVDEMEVDNAQQLDDEEEDDEDGDEEAEEMDQEEGADDDGVEEGEEEREAERLEEEETKTKAPRRGRPRGGRRASTRRAPASAGTPAAASPTSGEDKYEGNENQEDDGDNEDKQEDSVASSPPAAAASRGAPTRGRRRGGRQRGSGRGRGRRGG